MQLLIVPFLHLSFNISLWALFVCPVSRQLLSVTLHLSMLTPPCRSLTSVDLQYLTVLTLSPDVSVC